MTGRRGGPPVDYETLAEDLVALAYPMRLEILERLRFPHTLADIRVSPGRREGGARPGRHAAKQTVMAHLTQLMRAGLVRAGEEERKGKVVPNYVVNPQKLYAVTEELRLVSSIYSGRGAGGDATGTLVHQAPPPRARGPRLVVVHGVYEAKDFALDADSRHDGRWVIGRRPDASVALDYDPYTSMEHSAVTQKDGSYWLIDLEAKNGTWLNWGRLPVGGSEALETGDLIGVGRSLLLFLDR